MYIVIIIHNHNFSLKQSFLMIRAGVHVLNVNVTQLSLNSISLLRPDCSIGYTFFCIYRENQVEIRLLNQVMVIY